MLVCPVCEHSQTQGAECELCGRHFKRRDVVPDEVPPLAGLEPTHFESGEATPAELPPGFELTRIAATDGGPQVEVAGDSSDWLDPTACEQVPDIPAELLEIERAVSEDSDVPPLMDLSPPVCRYCQEPAPVGAALCEKCGMSLPRVRAAPPPEEAGQMRRCRSCGGANAGQRCMVCGSRFPDLPDQG